VREGDVVLEVNRAKITDAQSFGAQVNKQAKDESTLLLIRRDGGSIFLVVEPA